MRVVTAILLGIASTGHAFAVASSSKTRTHAFAVASSSKTRTRARARLPGMNLLESLMGGGTKGFAPPVVMGTEEMMSQKEFGTSAVPVQKDLRWSCDVKTADNICNYNRHYAEYD